VLFSLGSWGNEEQQEEKLKASCYFVYRSSDFCPPTFEGTGHPTTMLSFPLLQPHQLCRQAQAPISPGSTGHHGGTRGGGTGQELHWEPVLNGTAELPGQLSCLPFRCPPVTCSRGSVHTHSLPQGSAITPWVAKGPRGDSSSLCDQELYRALEHKGPKRVQLHAWFCLTPRCDLNDLPLTAGMCCHAPGGAKIFLHHARSCSHPCSRCGEISMLSSFSWLFSHAVSWGELHPAQTLPLQPAPLSWSIQHPEYRGDHGSSPLSASLPLHLCPAASQALWL